MFESLKVASIVYMVKLLSPVLLDLGEHRVIVLIDGCLC